jgi:hypothetical protein
LEAYGVKNGSVQSSAATAAKTRSELEAGRPVMVRYGYKSDQKKTGHVVTVKGYAYNSKTKVNDYSWQDPYTGTTKTGTYSYLLDNSTWAWTHTRTGLVKK